MTAKNRSAKRPPAAKSGRVSRKKVTLTAAAAHSSATKKHKLGKKKASPPPLTFWATKRDSEGTKREAAGTKRDEGTKRDAAAAFASATKRDDGTKRDLGAGTDQAALFATEPLVALSRTKHDIGDDKPDRRRKRGPEAISIA